MHSISASAQITKLNLRIDTVKCNWPGDLIAHQGQKFLPLFYVDENEVCEVKFKTASHTGEVTLIPSNDFELIDSLLFVGNEYRFKVRFAGLTQSNFLKFSFLFRQDSIETISDILLQPITNTTAFIQLRDDEIYIGEEKIVEIISGKPQNILHGSEWVSTESFEYRIETKNDQLLLYLLPTELGRRTLSLPLSTRKPRLDENKKLSYSVKPLEYAFFVKSSRLQFLSIDKHELTLDEKSRTEGIEIQISESRLLEMNKTYRIEDQEEAGGPLIAELHTKRKLANDKILCIVRPYNYHRNSEGYLYIKDGDDARFITNFSITHETNIQKLSILRKGGEWTTSNTIHPGEDIEVRIEGQGLHKAKFYFENLEDISLDTLLRNENRQIYKLHVPLSIPVKSVNILNHGKPTGKTLKLAEYQKPHDFDFLYVNYNGISRKVSSIHGPILYEKDIQDVIFSFNLQGIDKKELHGKQYVNIDIRITDKNNKLIEMRSIENIVICPGSSSPRFEFYSSTNCRSDELSLNKFLSRKTNDLDEWSKISLTFSHDRTKYGGEGYEKEVDIILKRSYSFDVEVSFPAGLVTVSKQEDGEVGFGSLSGISMAMIAQFSFYNPNKIARYRPYKIGAGFLAFNAFNFSDNAENRDVGIVILGSLYPTTRDVKLTFPLYIGGGYFLKDRKWFFLIGPGIRVKL